MKVTMSQSLDGLSMNVSVQMGNSLDRFLPGEIIKEIAKCVAEKYVSENYQEIVKFLDQRAIATLSVAEAGAAIRETLEKKIPDKILTHIVEKNKSKLVRLGLFGGIKEI